MNFYNAIRRKSKNVFTEDGINNNAPICTRIRPIRSKRDSREFKSGLIISPDIMLIPATTEEISRPALRPKYSVLDNSYFNKITQKPLPDWQDALKRYLRE